MSAVQDDQQFIVSKLKRTLPISKWKSILVKLHRRITERFRSKNQSYSQAGEDRIMNFIFNGLKKKKIKYLEIGSYHPKYINNTYLFYKDGSSGVCIEPDPILFRRLKRVRRRDTCLNVGVGTTKRDATSFYIMSSKTLNTFSEKEAKRYETFGQKIEQIVQVPMLTINETIEKHFSACPDLLSVDVEGLDFDIIKSLDFNKYKPDVICIETITYTEDNTERKVQELIDYICQKGYMVFGDTYINTIFVNTEKWQNR